MKLLSTTAIPRQTHSQRGIALIIVMIAITALSIMASGFAYSMKVEMKLARHATRDPELEWLGRSGVELAKYIIGQQASIPGQPYDAKNQLWYGLIGPTNGMLSDLSLTGNRLGNGTFSLKITDLERKLNINMADEGTLERALTLIGVDAGDFPTVISSILDWRDADDDTHPGGAESDYYESLDPPYVAKNGPIDDLPELLLIKGVSPEMYFGPGYSGPSSGMRRHKTKVGFSDQQPDAYLSGMAELFTPLSTRQININTADVNVLQLIPGVDTNMAASIINIRAGPDGQDGSDDDTPHMSANIPGLAGQGYDPVTMQQMQQRMRSYIAIRSSTFEVEVDVQLDDRKRIYYAIIRRMDARNVMVLNMYWK